MMVTCFSSALLGIEASLIQVEVDLSSGLPRFNIVGLPDSTVQEAKERVRSAIKNSGYEFPIRRITVNLAPADLPKEGAGFDLAMALGILQASGQCLSPDFSGYFVLGELGLDGTVRPLPGVLAMAGLLQKQSEVKMIVPQDNVKEAAVFPNLKVWPVRSLGEAVAVLEGGKDPVKSEATWFPDETWPDDLQSVKGQEHAKRCLEIAAAGNHNLLLIGPPGSGKTMLARRLPSILSGATFQESLEISKIQSVAGLLHQQKNFAVRRPFRAPHCSISYAGMVGGGNPVRPGELSLAHRGVLFMDEFPEFNRNVLESLRQPLEEKFVTVVRLSGSVTYPADFIFVGAMNPCPCGFYGDLHQSCLCQPFERIRYRKRISGPIMDRIDLHVEVSPLSYENLYGLDQSENSQSIKLRVLAARKLQAQRLGDLGRTNSGMVPEEIEAHCGLSSEADLLLKRAYKKLHLSARGHSKVLKVARTISDLANSANIEVLHLAEALQYRILDRSLYHE